MAKAVVGLIFDRRMADMRYLVSAARKYSPKGQTTEAF